MGISLEQLLAQRYTFPLLGEAISFEAYVKLDLSIDNLELKAINLASSEALEDYIWQFMKIRGAKVAYGGYLEKRAIYKRSSHFYKEDDIKERNIHLGLDLWTATNSPVFAPLEGKVHSFNFNNNFGDYGPTLILEHNFKGFNFFTLYGHLSLESIDNKVVGEVIEQGAVIGFLGSRVVNGDYPPHLHFQVINDIGGFIGDYPGVCSKEDLGSYLKNSTNPEIFLFR